MVMYLATFSYTLVEISGYDFEVKLPKHKSIVSMTWD